MTNQHRPRGVVDLTFSVSPKAIVRTLVWIVAVLTLANVVHQVSWYVFQRDYLDLGWKFDVSGELNIPTWYSSVALLLCAAPLLLCAAAERAAGGPSVRQWQGLAAIFVFLSVDEAAALHEWIGDKLRPLELGGFFYYAWTFPGLLLAIAVAVLYARFVWRLPARTRWLVVLAATLYVGGGLGVEMLNAKYDTLTGGQNLPYQVTTAIEELAEMAGVLVFIHALLHHLVAVQRVRRVALEVRDGGRTPT